MEFPFTVAPNLNPNASGGPIVTVTASSLSRLGQDGKQNARAVLDVFGQRSAKAQKLGAPITSFAKLSGASEQTLYMQHDGNKALGFIKVGKRRLFIHHHGRMKEIVPLCVLDFYVHESTQRMGVGSKLFRFMLQDQRAHPSKLAYDRPSPKFIAFLRKYYSLTDFEKQNNNYVVFNQYFADHKPDALKRNSKFQSLSQRPLTARDRFGRKIRKGSAKRMVSQQQYLQPQSQGQNHPKQDAARSSLPQLQPLNAVRSAHQDARGVPSPQNNTSVAIQAAAQRSNMRKKLEMQNRVPPHGGGIGIGGGTLPPIGGGTKETIQDLLRAARQESRDSTTNDLGASGFGSNRLDTDFNFNAAAVQARSLRTSPQRRQQKEQSLHTQHLQRDAEVDRLLGRLRKGQATTNVAQQPNLPQLSPIRGGRGDIALHSGLNGTVAGKFLDRNATRTMHSGPPPQGLLPLSPSSLRRTSRLGNAGTSVLHGKDTQPQLQPMRGPGPARSGLPNVSVQNSYSSPLGTAMPRYQAPDPGVVGFRQRLLF